MLSSCLQPEFDRKGRSGAGWEAVYTERHEFGDPAMNAIVRPDTILDTDNADDLWAALGRRDQTFDGRFVYSVRTTGVYCRPSCPARPARRENVAFHAAPAAAEAAGFRACLRCRPDGESLQQRHAAMIDRACRLIDSAEEEPDLEALAKGAGLSRFHFHRLFKDRLGVTPKSYAAARRADADRGGPRGSRDRDGGHLRRRLRLERPVL